MDELRVAYTPSSLRARRLYFLKPSGSWTNISERKALLGVAYGETSSYLGLAEKVGNKSAVRAVASANGANAISIIVPCHRIIGSKGELVGYAGGLRAKERLLALECGLFALV